MARSGEGKRDVYSVWRGRWCGEGVERVLEGVERVWRGCGEGVEIREVEKGGDDCMETSEDVWRGPEGWRE